MPATAECGGKKKQPPTQQQEQAIGADYHDKRQNSPSSSSVSSSCAYKGCSHCCTLQQVHMRVHTGERQFVCTFPSCTYRAAAHCNLRQHMNNAHEQKKKKRSHNKCPHPGCTTSTYSAFFPASKNHEKTPHGKDKAFKCEHPACNHANAAYLAALRRGHYKTHYRKKNRTRGGGHSSAALPPSTTHMMPASSLSPDWLVPISPAVPQSSPVDKPIRGSGGRVGDDTTTNVLSSQLAPTSSARSFHDHLLLLPTNAFSSTTATATPSSSPIPPPHHGAPIPRPSAAGYATSSPLFPNEHSNNNTFLMSAPILQRRGRHKLPPLGLLLPTTTAVAMAAEAVPPQQQQHMHLNVDTDEYPAVTAEPKLLSPPQQQHEMLLQQEYPNAVDMTGVIKDAEEQFGLIEKNYSLDRCLEYNLQQQARYIQSLLGIAGHIVLFLQHQQQQLPLLVCDEGYTNRTTTTRSGIGTTAATYSATAAAPTGGGGGGRIRLTGIKIEPRQGEEEWCHH